MFAVEGTQLVGPVPTAGPDPDVVELGAADVPEMLALADATRPGPFWRRTHELGRYVGVRDGGRLVAMVGERLRPPGWTEISGVCTLTEGNPARGLYEHLGFRARTAVRFHGAPCPTRYSCSGQPSGAGPCLDTPRSPHSRKALSMTRVPAFVVSVCLLLLGLGVPADAAGHAHHHGGRWTAPHGPYFNDPHVPSKRYVIERRVVDTIRHTPKGETIRIAVYSFDRMPVAHALVDAFHRGVRVQMLLNDHQDTAAMEYIRSAIGTDRHATSFLYQCHESCRGTATPLNNMHAKWYSFTRAGRSTDVMAVGSANMMLNADRHQWNDLYFMSGDAELFQQFTAWFVDMKHDYETRQPPINFCGAPANGTQCDDAVDTYNTWIFPRPSSPTDDLVLDTLGKVQCLTPDGAGGQTRTELDLAMHTMRGNRGDYLASAIRQKYAEGCDVRVDYGLIGFHTKQILGAVTPRGRIPLRSTGLDFHPDDDFDLNHDGEDDVILDYYSHQKYLVVDGTYDGVPGTQMVLTGSSNWASLSTANDEVWFTVHGPGVTRRYVKNFDVEWDSPVNSRNAYTATYTDFRVPVTVRAADGSEHTVMRTERRKVVSVEPDPPAPAEAWED